MSVRYDEPICLYCLRRSCSFRWYRRRDRPIAHRPVRGFDSTTRIPVCGFYGTTHILVCGIYSTTHTLVCGFYSTTHRPVCGFYSTTHA